MYSNMRKKEITYSCGIVILKVNEAACQKCLAQLFNHDGTIRINAKQEIENIDGL